MAAEWIIFLNTACDSPKPRGAREHIEAKVIMEKNQQGWLNRYDLTLQRYKDNNIKVLAMLAYNPDGGFYAPDPKEWEEFLTLVVSRWHDKVDAWEVWNEPDTDHFLQIPNPMYYRQIIEPAYEIIKRIDPSSTVVSGGLYLSESLVCGLYAHELQSRL